MRNSLGTFLNLFFILCSALFSGCNFASQSYNFGTLLAPGETATVLGAGRRPFYTITKSQADDGTAQTSSVSIDTATNERFVYGGQLRIGVFPALPFGGGLNLGLAVEYPGQLAEDAGLPVVECDVLMGLPARPASRFTYYHNITLGWTIGSWIDNGWFTEYAGSFDTKHIIPYYNARVLLVSTSVLSDSTDFTDKNLLKEHDLSVTARLCAGVAVKLPTVPVLPDFIVPEAALFFPRYSPVTPIGITYHIGFRWHCAK